MNAVTFRIIGVVTGLAVIAISVWYGTNGGWLLPVEGSTEAALIDQLFRAMLVISTIIFLGVQGTILYSAFAFGKKKGDETDALPEHGNVNLEVFWTAVPSALVLWLSVYSYDVTNQVVAVGASGGLGCSVDCPMILQNTAATTGKELVINVIAQQYGWTFQYPGSKEEVGEMRVPKGREVYLNMVSKDVIHAFWVPQFRLKQDVIPGRITRLKFTATTPGEYPLVCAELCGAYHGAMRSNVFVDEPAEFDRWAETELGIKTAQQTQNLLAQK